MAARRSPADRVRIVHLTTSDISLELLLGPQLEAFGDAGYEVIGMSAPGPFVPAIEARGVPHAALEHATRSMALREDARAVGELLARFRDLRPTIVHTHNPKPGVYGRIAARAAGVPIVVNTVHGLFATPEDRLAKRAVVYGLERAASMCSDAELIQNPEDARTLRRLGVPRSKLTVLGNGVDLARFGPDPRGVDRAELRDEWGIDRAATVVGAVGRLVLEKGYAELLDAWRSVAAIHPEARLVIIGPDDEDKVDALPFGLREDAARLGVRFLGHRHDVERCYRALDVFVLASHREGFPRAAIEAAASGVPTIATDIRGCRQVVSDGETGVLVPVRDPVALASALSALLSDPERRSVMSMAARQKAVGEFDQRRVIELTLATYARLLAVAQA